MRRQMRRRRSGCRSAPMNRARSLVGRIAGGTAPDGAHGVIGAGHAVHEPVLAAYFAQRLADVLAQDDAAILQLDLENRAVGRPQAMPPALGKVIWAPLAA